MPGTFYKQFCSPKQLISRLFAGGSGTVDKTLDFKSNRHQAATTGPLSKVLEQGP